MLLLARTCIDIKDGCGNIVWLGFLDLIDRPSAVQGDRRSQ